MNIDPNIVLAIISVIAVVSPIATAIISNWHQTKLKKLDMYEDVKRKTLSDFIDSAQEVMFAPDELDAMVNYSANFDKLFIYFDDISVETIKPFDHARTNYSNSPTPENLQTANRQLSYLVSNLSKQIKKK